MGWNELERRIGECSMKNANLNTFPKDNEATISCMRESPILSLSDVEGLFDKWGQYILASGQKIPTKTGYLRRLLDLCEFQFKKRPKLDGLKIKVMSIENPIATAVLFNGVWIKPRAK